MSLKKLRCLSVTQNISKFLSIIIYFFLINAISFTSEHSGTQTIIGRGAGGIETASSILRDLIDIRNESTKT